MNTASLQKAGQSNLGLERLFKEILDKTTREKMKRRKQEDLADALLEFIELAKMHLSWTIVKMIRIGGPGNMYSRPSYRPFTSFEVAYILGTAAGGVYYYHRGALHEHLDNNDPSALYVHAVPKEKITEDIADTLLRNINSILDEDPKALVSGDFFVFQYAVRLKDDSQKYKEVDVVIAAHDFEYARNVFLGHESIWGQGHSIDVMENLRVYHNGEWNALEKSPISGDQQGLARISGCAITLEIRK